MGLVPCIPPVFRDREAAGRAFGAAVEELELDDPIVVAVTGTTAVTIDVSNRVSASLLPFVGIVVGLSLLLLLIVEEGGNGRTSERTRGAAALPRGAR